MVIWGAVLSSLLGDGSIVSVCVKINSKENPRDKKVQNPPPIVIRPSGGWVALRLIDVWECRELLYFLVWRDLKVRYKQTVIGVAWVLIQPTFLTLAFSIFFGRLAGIPSGVPYPLFAYCGILPWQLFAQALSGSANSLISNETLITKVYFPRLVIPLAAVFSALVDFVLHRSFTRDGDFLWRCPHLWDSFATHFCSFGIGIRIKRWSLVFSAQRTIS